MVLSLSFIVYVAEFGSELFVSAKISANFVFFSSFAPASCAHRLKAFRCKLFSSKYEINFLYFSISNQSMFFSSHAEIQTSIELWKKTFLRITSNDNSVCDI